MRILPTLVVLVALLVACSAPAPPPAPTASGASTLSQWEQDTLKAAQQEGKVVVYGFWNPQLEQMVTSLMAQRYPGVTLETLTSTTAPEKIRAEQQSGQYYADVYLGGL